MEGPRLVKANEETVHKFVDKNPGVRFSLIHFDCDLYNADQGRAGVSGTKVLAAAFCSSTNMEYRTGQERLRRLTSFWRTNRNSSSIRLHGRTRRRPIWSSPDPVGARAGFFKSTQAAA
jgi:hypothetical protein